MNIKCRYSGLKPNCAVIVATGLLTALYPAFMTPILADCFSVCLRESQYTPETECGTPYCQV